MSLLARLFAFEAKGMTSMVMWLARRRNGVPHGATAVGYAREQSMTLVVILFVMVVETVGIDLLLIALDVPLWLRAFVLIVDIYGILFALALGAGSVTRPHVVTPDELRIRYAVYFDLRVPRDLIQSVRLARNFNENSMVAVKDGRLSVAVSSQTNVLIELTEPVTVTRPLGGSAEATTIRFFADTPAAVVTALRA
ncbi:hypothetical protein OIE66_37155 [Nonomuraea sp. NBC_01738]|uniref:hypothetical protein n=1 Tax=Nonomuraea sp. NBC_01738 TaxID=2976003 RepID=UPI002E0EEB95|nr:hypothetical protein OIE66_37155 [Nonomuraea sp. NBC_01738]